MLPQKELVVQFVRNPVECCEYKAEKLRFGELTNLNSG